MQRNEEYGFTWIELKFDRHGFDMSMNVNLTDLAEAVREDADTKALTDLILALTEDMRVEEVAALAATLASLAD